MLLFHQLILHVVFAAVQKGLCVNMQQHSIFIEPIIIKYLNRLSDYLFVLARFTAQELHVAEIIWKGRE